jgi:hypothetical protein
MAKIVRLVLAHPSGEKRHVSAAAESEDEAVAIVEGQEAGHVGFVLDPAEAKELEAKMREGILSGRDKARLLSHQQDVPYKVAKAKES